MTESSVYSFNIVLLIAIAIFCAATHQWAGVVGSLVGLVNAYAARYFLIKWKPNAEVE